MPWLSLISKHLAGQSLVNITNILVGIILLRILSIEEFALYTLSVLLLQVAAGGSDMGLSQALLTLGARLREQPQSIGCLYSSACVHAYKLYVVSAFVVIGIFLFYLFGHAWSPVNAAACLLLLLLIAAIQLSVNLRKSVLNINHDASGLFHIGMVEAGMRFVLLPLCMIWPYAAVALFISFTGAYASRIVARDHSKHKMAEHQFPFEKEKQDLKRFISPLIPVVIYNSLQGQLSVFMLGLYGYTASIAQVGALGRLGQVISIPLMLNGFLIQPIFSRIKNKTEFVKKAMLVSVSLGAFSLISMVSVFVVPHWWLVILGHNYDNLVHELPIAVLTALSTLLGATFYTMVISRNTTQGQSWYIAAGVLGQFAFIWIRGVHSTFDALLLSFVPVLGYCFVQAVLLVAVISGWKEESRFQNSSSLPSEIHLRIDTIEGRVPSIK